MRARFITATIVLAFAAGACSDPPAAEPVTFGQAVAAAQTVIDEASAASGVDLGDLRLSILTARCGPVDEILRGPEALMLSDEVPIDDATRASVIAALEAAATARRMDISARTGFLAFNGLVPSEPMDGTQFAIGRIQLPAGDEPSPVIVTIVLGDEIDLPAPPEPAICG